MITRTFRTFTFVLLGLTVVALGAGCAGPTKAQIPDDAAAQEGDQGDEEVIFPLTLIEAETAKGVTEKDGLFEPIEPTDTFHYTDRQVVAYAIFAHIVDPEQIKLDMQPTLRWKWYDPKGELYADSKDLRIVPPGLYHPRATAYHAINIDGEKASTLPGTWKVILFVGTAPVAEIPFTIERTFRPGG